MSTGFKFVPRSSIRERSLQEVTKLVRSRLDTARTLEAERLTDLSPLERDLNRAYIRDLEAAITRLEDDYVLVKQQSAAADEAEEELAAKPPLERASIRSAYYRSGKDRSAAIAGIFERERRQPSEFTRDMHYRVQAIAAARRKARAAVIRSPENMLMSDPCEEWRIAEKLRRQVLFAKGLAGTGYRTPHHSRKPPGC